jgi:hypothetical protein
VPYPNSNTRQRPHRGALLRWLCAFALVLWTVAGAAGCEAEQQAGLESAKLGQPDASGTDQAAYSRPGAGGQASDLGAAPGSADAGAHTPDPPAEDAGKAVGNEASDQDTSEPVAADAGAAPPNHLDGEGTWAFRISNLQLRSPPLCYASTQANPAGGCLNVEGEANDLLSMLLDDPDEPLDLVGVFDKSPLGGRSVLSFGAGICERDDEGEVLSCALLRPAVAFEGISGSSETPCLLSEPERRNQSSVEIEAPCFVTDQAPIEVSLLGASLDLRGARVAGTLSSVDLGFDISGGHLGGFLPEEVAKTLSMDLQTGSGQGSVTLADLLHAKARTSSADGEEGWELVLVFEATAVEVDEL